MSTQNSLTNLEPPRAVSTPNLVEGALDDAIHRLRASEKREHAAVQRIESLQQATAALASALTFGAVAEVLLSFSERALGAVAGVVYLARDESDEFELIGARGVPPAARFPKLSQVSSSPLARAIEQRTAYFFTSYAELIESFPAVAGAHTPKERMGAVAALPLFYADRALGGFALSFAEARSFDEADRAWLSGFAAQCALAAERARLYGAEQAARAEAEALLRVSESLARSDLDIESLVQRVTDEATALTGADFGAFFYNVVGDTGESYVLYSLSGARKEAFARLGLPRNTPLFSATFSGEGVVRLDDVRKDPRYGKVGPHHGMPEGHLPVVSYLAVPVISRSGEVLGGLFFGHREPGRFSAKNERVVSLLASLAASAIDNARLLTAARSAERSQRRVVEELTETLRLNDLLAGVLAHDLRNPLGAILMSAELGLRHGARGDTEALEKPLRKIVSSGTRMARMIGQLLDFTRIRLGGGLELDARELDLGGLVERAREELEGAVPGVRFTLSSRGDTRGTWDEDRLLQAFSNLLANAAQHGKGDVEIELDGSDLKAVRVEVRNPGAISSEALNTLFTPLARPLGARDRASGLGLGLFITREIATAHGGTIEVSSSEEAGTSFLLKLPRVTAKAPEAMRGAPSAPPRTKPWDGERIGEAGQKFRFLVESVKDYAIFMLDTTGRVATWNAGAERIKGYAAREILGQHFSIFYEDAEVNAGVCEEELEIAAREGRFEAEGFRLRKDGTRFWANVVITALHGPNGKLMGFAKVTRDLTERRKLESERLRRAQAEEAVRLRDEFLALASHELKTPLTVLELQLDAIAEYHGRLDAPLIRNVERAKRSSEQLSRRVESLIEVTRLVTGTFVLSLERFDLAEAVKEVVLALESAALRAGSPLSLRIDAAPVGSWDRVRIQRIVTNLIWNAITHASRTPVTVSLDAKDGVALLSVSDLGPGIPLADQERIFSRFEHAATTRHHPGLGLGLYVSREIARAHGGSITVSSLPEGGARFEVRIPIESSKVAEDD